jgi:SAM-dependent methyltransferase
MHPELATNQSAWDIVAPRFHGTCALPTWGPFDVCKDHDLLGDISGQTVLEVGCGSGHSLAYLIHKGVKKAYGLDFSATQLAFATELNREAIEADRIQLIRSPMEHSIDIQPVDLIVSVYAMGWTLDPQALFRNMWSYLKPGGRLVWSWGHWLFDSVQYENARFVLHKPYFDEIPYFSPSWNGSKGIYMQHRTIATWFRHQTEAGFLVRNFLEPQPLSTADAPDDPTRYYSAVKANNIPGTIIFLCEKPCPSQSRVAVNASPVDLAG